MPPLLLTNRWTSTYSSLRIKVARQLDRPATALKIEALLRQHGHPVAYEVFDHDFVLCEPHLPGVRGDPDIAIVIGDAEHDLFFVAQRERGGLGFVSVHEAIGQALRDFLDRAMGSTSHPHVAAVIVEKGRT
ncbi:MAG: hypothetical protein MUC44_01375 [Beijerinckiaceae bacterium]|jgi:hypothetical protein|nr:hypothetical protein [Beijerinckiaceae bacterium]